MLERLLLAGVPRRRVARRVLLGREFAVQGLGAPLHDAGHLAAEPVPDLLRFDPGVFDRVVQECGDRLGLVAAVQQDERSDVEQVRDVRHVGAFPRLRAVELGGPFDGPREAWTERGRRP